MAGPSMTGPGTPVIKVRDVSVRFPGVLALDRVSLAIQPGTVHAIVGENGAGKSTLMKLLSGVQTRYTGQLELRGTPQRFHSTRDAEQAGISIIHQELNLVEELSIAANLFLGRELRGAWGWLRDREMRERTGHWLRQVGCELEPGRLVGGLRVGDQQLVEIARALSRESNVLILDEPTSALTQTEADRLMSLIGTLKARGVTMLYISHKMDEVFRIADTITVLRDGRLIDTRPASQTTPREIAHLMVGRDLAPASSTPPRTPGPVLLKVDQLSLPRVDQPAQDRLRNISLEVRAGEVVGLAGLLGAGRTELLECLFGASPVQFRGSVQLAGQQLAFRHPSEALAAGVVLITEDRKRLGIFDELPVGANITLAALRQATLGGLVVGSQERGLVETTIDRLRIKTAGPEGRITQLSGGNQQKCLLGRALLMRPRLLLLDDPTRGVDVGAKAELYQLVDSLVREGLAVIVTSSELPELLTMSDRIVVLCEGRVTAELTRAEATEQRIMEAATMRQATG
ncbi:MAG: sugar ABC transporter ATP-binding protein [Planctomycetaceae bacterium]